MEQKFSVLKILKKLINKVEVNTSAFFLPLEIIFAHIRSSDLIGVTKTKID